MFSLFSCFHQESEQKEGHSAPDQKSRIDRVVFPYYLNNVGDVLKPLDWIAGYKSPVLFIQGQNDDIVKPEQTERYLHTRGNDQDVAVYIPNADHSFTTAENFDEVLRQTEDWLVDRLTH